jgi:hypothetical protein
MITGAIIPADERLSAYSGAWWLQDLADAAIRSRLDCVEQAVARERKIETGTDGPTVANAVSHAIEELRDIQGRSRGHGGWVNSDHG